MTLLEDVTPHIREVESVLGTAKDEIRVAGARLTTIKEDTIDAQLQLDTLNDSVEEMQTAHDELATKLNESIEVLQKREHIVSEKLLNEVEKMAKYKIEQGKLIEANEKFKNYESKAQKVLDAKEASLLAREHVLIQKENLTGRPKGVLSELKD